MKANDYISIGEVVLPNIPLSNIDIEKAAKTLKLPNFRGVFLRDQLPKKLMKNECGIINLDDSSGNGTHYCCWYVNPNGYENIKYYFDSYGIQPPNELINYLKSPIYYNSERIQPDGEVFCGHLCLYMLMELSQGKNLQSIINNLY